MTEKKVKNVFVEGPIPASFIAQSIEKHSTMHDIGAHSIFLGQVRADEKEGRKVRAIDYTCYREMADLVFHEIREETFAKFHLTCMHIYHSLGYVKSGEISLFVFTSSKHRRMAIDACSYVVEEIKSKAPVWGKEIFEDESHEWKVNSRE
ncbi:MAG: molybdenum cofactor biosynthesis protein MoaE [Alphaproteobacteria bacterium]|jgi:molybdopterin synthase catalytic subunit